VRIICPRCGTEYTLESTTLDREGTSVQCSACEHVFTVFGPDLPSAPVVEKAREVSASANPGPAATAISVGVTQAPPTATLGGATSSGPAQGVRAPGLFLAQGDRIYKVKDISTLQRWIVEKRVLPSDRLSPDGKSWEVVSQKSDLAPFFAVLDQLKAARRALQRTRESGVMGTADPATALDTAPPLLAPSGPRSTQADLKPAPAVAPRPQSRPAAPRPQSRPAAPVPAAPGNADASEEGANGVSESFSSAGSSLFGAEYAARASTSEEFDAEREPDEEGTILARVDATREVHIQAPRPAPRATRPERDEHLPDPEPVALPAAVRAERNWDPHGGRRMQGATHGDASSSALTGVAPAASAPDVGNTGISTAEFTIGPTGDRHFYVIVSLAALAAVVLLWFFLAGPGSSSEETIPQVAGGADTPEGHHVAAESPTPSDPTPEAGAKPPPVAAPEPPAGEAQATVVRAQERSPRSEPPTPAGGATVGRPAPTPAPAVSKAPSPVAAVPAVAPPPARKQDTAGVLANADKARSRGDFAAAVKLYDQALTADPGNFSANLQKGWCHIELGQAGLAASAFKKAVGLRGGSAEAHYGLGLAYQDLGKTGDARTEYEKVIELDPAGRDAAEVRALLHQLSGG
jgi:predicted Zn finger-like uncharacterized protein